MTPETKFHSLVLGLTVTLMFAALSKLVPLIEQANVLEIVFGSGAAFLASAGAYGLIAKSLMGALRRSRWVKAKLLGAHYMEGTWVGYFKGHRGDIRFVVEVFEQDLSSLNIAGKSYTVTNDLHGQWASDAASLDVERGRLIFTSSADFLTRGVTVQSVGVFQLERDSPKSAPKAIEGYVADLVDGIRIAMREEKISTRVMAFKDALPHAQEMARRMMKAQAEPIAAAQRATPPVSGGSQS